MTWHAHSVSVVCSSSPPTRRSWRSGTRSTLKFSLDSPVSASFKPSAMPRNGVTVWSAFPARTKYFAPSDRPYMVNLVVDDLDGALKQVKAGGAKIVGKIQEASYGRFGWFLDPDGNKVELWEPSKK